MPLLGALVTDQAFRGKMIGHRGLDFPSRGIGQSQHSEPSFGHPAPRFLFGRVYRTVRMLSGVFEITSVSCGIEGHGAFKSLGTHFGSLTMR